MGLFDVFTFKQKISDVFSKENISDILAIAKRSIIVNVQKNIPGAEKKLIVDELVVSALRNKVVGCSNKIVLWVVLRVVDIVPIITQSIYDNLKDRIEDLTV